MKIVSSCEKISSRRETRSKKKKEKLYFFVLILKLETRKVFHALVGLAGLTICSNRKIKALNHNENSF